MTCRACFAEPGRCSRLLRRRVTLRPRPFCRAEATIPRLAGNLHSIFLFYKS
ncbi:hypothetical protein AXF42_Ash010916 [Apostasia shenzhenica]|uniref:Uncharacterized protein n=1 Tax=Apostasia shenzhenica TaxID=1088818 RepID=A0A2H9ZQL3_9ASPA|nr:hypothetical protein AXF42_Ash010916 [Apostasia shenzhenica]